MSIQYKNKLDFKKTVTNAKKVFNYLILMLLVIVISTSNLGALHNSKNLTINLFKATLAPKESYDIPFISQKTLDALATQKKDVMDKLNDRALKIIKEKIKTPETYLLIKLEHNPSQEIKICMRYQSQDQRHLIDIYSCNKELVAPLLPIFTYLVEARPISMRKKSLQVQQE